MVGILKFFGCVAESIQVKPEQEGCIATVKFRDTKTAERLVDAIENIDGDGDAGELKIKIVPTATKYGNRLQLNSIRCSWYRPYRKASLIFGTLEAANTAHE